MWAAMKSTAEASSGWSSQTVQISPVVTGTGLWRLTHCRMVIWAATLFSTLISSRMSSNDRFGPLDSRPARFAASACILFAASACSDRSICLLFSPSRISSNEGHSVLSSLDVCFPPFCLRPQRRMGLLPRQAIQHPVQRSASGVRLVERLFPSAGLLAERAFLLLVKSAQLDGLVPALGGIVDPDLRDRGERPGLYRLVPDHDAC